LGMKRRKQEAWTGTWIGAAVLLAAVLELMGQRAAGDPEKEGVTALIRQLGNDAFKVREAAEKELKQCSRTVLPALREHERSPDPEIKERVRRVIRFIGSDPSKIPQNFFAFDAMAELSYQERNRRWNDTMNSWYEKATITAGNTNGMTGGGFCAQSFIPHCEQIQAVSLQSYPISHGWGWLCLEVREEAKELPSDFVLARCWIRVEKKCPAQHSAYLVYDLPDFQVQAEKSYWLVFIEYPDKDSPHGSITNCGLSSNSDYAEGKMTRNLHDRPLENEDAKFLIISKCVQVPFVHKAGEEELKTLPAEAGVRTPSGL